MISMSKRLVKISCKAKDCLRKALCSSFKDFLWSLKDDKDDEDSGGIPPSSSWARTSSEGIGRMRLGVGFRHLIVVETSLQEGLDPRASHLVLLFTAPLTLTSRVVFSMADVDVVVVAFAFQLPGMNMVAFAGASVTGSVFLVAYEAVGISGRNEKGGI